VEAIFAWGKQLYSDFFGLSVVLALWMLSDAQARGEWVAASGGYGTRFSRGSGYERGRRPARQRSRGVKAAMWSKPRSVESRVSPLWIQSWASRASIVLICTPRLLPSLRSPAAST